MLPLIFGYIQPKTALKAITMITPSMRILVDNLNLLSILNLPIKYGLSAYGMVHIVGHAVLNSGRLSG
jgi:hypothetical protein